MTEEQAGIVSSHSGNKAQQQVGRHNRVVGLCGGESKGWRCYCCSPLGCRAVGGRAQGSALVLLLTAGL
ncbi:hypothetical protein B484DRAFT_195791 [Ochromonadaceae sp. CCMP2298]|nr:hypothetical protein B484DRAFT_195791 [Ochromonadaceae sp. CCMP2298]